MEKCILCFANVGLRQSDASILQNIYKLLTPNFKIILQGGTSLLNSADSFKLFDEAYNFSRNKDTIAHVFSINGTSALLSSLFEPDYQTPKQLLNIKGIIWDSAPCINYNSNFLDNFTASLFQMMDEPTHFTDKQLKKQNSGFIGVVDKRIRELSQKIHMLYNSPLKLPQLIIGSKKDRFINPSDMVSYAKKAKECGANISTKFWDDSDHVKLMNDHHDEYSRTFCDFCKQNL